ncbi:helix-turn-helix domain-containing protein, partial [Aldersonia kunmingensis]|uniref:helix-turn-helix domain-containing protein n=1 Tax=Aldersonia kunmingensis TaxID=408066 RepID=UPI000A0042BA
MTATGNARLRAARQAVGLRSQAALAEAVTQAARSIGLRVAVTARTVRRWESSEPPWPHPDHARALEALFQRPVAELGFTPPWSEGATAAEMHAAQPVSAAIHNHRRLGPAAAEVPSSVVSDYAIATSAYRRMYWSLAGARVHQPVSHHAVLGGDLLDHIPQTERETLARAVSECSLLAGRIEFFDLQKPELAQQSFVLSLQAAHEANDSLLGAAALAHMAFPPAFSGDRSRAEEARDRVRAARAFARRGDANGEMHAWLDAVEAEVETRFGDTRRALDLLHHAEQLYEAKNDRPSPLWMDWFSEIRLAGFKGNTLLAAGRGRDARETLERVLADLPDDAVKQQSVVLTDLAAAAVVEKSPELACTYLSQALDQLGHYWYATAMDRVKTVRQSLRKWDSIPEVRDLDERLYNWHTT